MDVEEIRALRDARPYRPFNLIVRDGRKLPVDKPYYVAISPDERWILHTKIGDGFEGVVLENVVGVDFDDPDGLRWNGRKRPAGHV